MADASHTKGPWSPKDGLIFGVNGAPIIAPFSVGAYTPRYQHLVTDEVRANGRVIEAAPELYDMAIAGQRMREAQKAYFRNRTHANLLASKEAEAEFDRFAAAALAKVEAGL